MNYGIIKESLIPVRKKDNSKSEMINQLLFGETFKIIEKSKKWSLISSYLDNYGEIFFEFDSFVSLSNLSSGTSTIPIFGSIVQKGKFAASAFLEAVKALNKVDFPTFGKPTIPHLNPIKTLIYFT